MPRKPKPPRATHCQWCGDPLPAKRKSTMLFCPDRPKIEPTLGVDEVGPDGALLSAPAGTGVRGARKVIGLDARPSSCRTAYHNAREWARLPRVTLADVPEQAIPLADLRVSVGGRFLSTAEIIGRLIRDYGTTEQPVPEYAKTLLMQAAEEDAIRAVVTDEEEADRLVARAIALEEARNWSERADLLWRVRERVDRMTSE